MGPVRRVFEARGKSSAPKKNEWIAVYFKLSSGEYGTEDERESIHKFTDQLDNALRESGTGIFDGDEFGNGECGLFMYGPDADQLFVVVEPFLRGWEPLKGGYAIKRYGAPPGQSERIEFS